MRKKHREESAAPCKTEAFNSTYWRKMFDEYNRRLSALEKRRSVEQFGAYEKLDHEPTEEEAEQFAQRLFAALLPAIKDRAVIKKHWPATEGGTEYWTVGLKLMVPKASKDVEAG